MLGRDLRWPPMRTTCRLLLVPAALVALAACSSDNKGATAISTTTATAAATTTPVSSDTEKPVSGDAAEITVKVGKDDSPDRVEHVDLGQTVDLRLLSDSDEDYHVHGYDLEGKAAAGLEKEFVFTADKVGRFEVETHTTSKVLLVLEVS